MITVVYGAPASGKTRRAEKLPSDYIIDPIVDGKPLTKTAQIRMCGNSVCPPMSEALVRANFGVVAAEKVAA